MAEKLTDDQLRKELQAFGEKSVGPIIPSTRALYVKKLNHYRARNKSATNAASKKTPSKKLLGFSSDESDDGQSNVSKRGIFSRDTLSGARNRRRAPPGPLSGRTPKPVGSELSRSSLGSFNGSTYFNNESDFTLDDVDMSHVSVASAGAQTSFLSFNDTKDSENSFDLESHNESMPGWKTGESSDSDSPQMPTKAKTTRYDVRKTVSPGCSSWSSNSNSHPMNNSHRYSSKPQASPRMRSLANNSRKPIAPERVNNASNSHYTHPASQAYKIKKQDKTVDRSHYISMFLLVLAGVFFSALAFTYMNMGTTATDNSANLMICPKDRLASTIDEDCFPEDTVRRALKIVQKLAASLSQKAGQFNCGFSSNGPNFSFEEFLQFISSSGFDRDDADAALHLINKNPQWEISLLNQREERIDSEPFRATDVYYMLSLSPDMSLWCRLSRATSHVFYILLITAVCICCFFVGLALLRFYWRRRDEQDKALFDLVEHISNVVRGHNETYQKAKDDGKTDLLPYIAIPHVRDMLIPPKDRRKKKDLWEKAVKCISANESRIREEIQIIANEEYFVWRWLQPGPNGKVWQGQAFGDNAKGCSNTTPYAPCLKIRNMFDAEVEYGEDWHVAIQDAILEKCGSHHGVVHIAVDKASKEGCVYVKCLSHDDAGKVYKALHGSYFDGVLVTVKYIRLERYHNRFPEAMSSRVPLTPSNNEKRSLSVPAHSSIIESS